MRAAEKRRRPRGSDGEGMMCRGGLGRARLETRDSKDTGMSGGDRYGGKGNVKEKEGKRRENGLEDRPEPSEASDVGLAPPLGAAEA